MIEVKHRETGEVLLIVEGDTMEGIHLAEINLQGVDLRAAKLRNACLVRAGLRDADLAGADLRRSHLKEADLADAVLRGAILRGADLTAANCTGADLCGADLRGSILAGAKLDTVRYDRDTKWRPGFDPQERGALLIGPPPESPHGEDICQTVSSQKGPSSSTSAGHVSTWSDGTEVLIMPDYPRESDNIPTDGKGRPDLGYFTQPLEYYVRIYEEYLAYITSDRKPVVSDADLKRDWIEGGVASDKRIVAIWGLIAKKAEALPYVMEMLKSSVPDAREDAGGILPEIGRLEGVVDALLETIDTETDPVALDSMVLAIGELGNKKVIPILARFIRDREMDQESSWGAMQSLGRLVRRRFDKQADPMVAAQEWLTKHGF